MKLTWRMPLGNIRTPQLTPLFIVSLMWTVTIQHYLLQTFIFIIIIANKHITTKQWSHAMQLHNAMQDNLCQRMLLTYTINQYCKPMQHVAAYCGKKRTPYWCGNQDMIDVGVMRFLLGISCPIFVCQMHLTDYLITLVSVCESVHRSVVERLRPQFFTDFHQILHAAQKCGCFERYCFLDKPEVDYRF